MNLFQNPFYIIGVSTRDSKQAIVEACDAKSLTVDAELSTVLTQPRKRLSAELAWLPGLSPARALGLIEKLGKDPKSFLASLNGVNPLARCNALVTYLEHHKPKEESQINGLLIEIAQSFDQIDFTSLLAVINEDRQIAKIPVIQDVENIKQEMQTRREYMIGTMKNCLNNTKAPDKVLTEIVAKTTSDGKQHPPLLVEELTDKYQIEVQKYLDQLVGQIRNVISNIEKQPKKMFEYQMPNLYKYLKAWDQIAQPIQLIHHSKGLDDSHSKELAQDLRGLAITMANTYEMHSEAKQITKVVAEIFKELPQFAEMVFEDLTALDDIINRKTKSKEEERKWREECSLDIEFGTIFKKRLTITPEIIRFKNEQIPTTEVTGVRWGATATKHSVNFIPTGTTYSFSIRISSNQKAIHVEPPDQSLYNMIVERIWKAMCVRLFSDTLRRLSDGDHVNFGNGDAIVNKNGIILKKHKIIGRSEPVLCKWENLSISNGNGTFIIEASADKSIGTELSYKDVDNVHILEAILRFLWKDGNYAKLRRGEFSESPPSSENENECDTAESKLSYEAFVRKAIVALRERGSNGIHSVHSGFNDDFKKYYEGEDPMEAINRLASEGKIEIVPMRDGIMLYLPGEAPGRHISSESEHINNSEENFIKVRCPACKDVMTVSLQFTPRGSTVACSNCNRKFTLPDRKKA